MIEQRLVYMFKCKGCGMPRRTSIKKDLADKELCRKCRKPKIDKDQIPMFEQI